MMKKRKLWSVTPIAAVLTAVLLLVVGVTFFLNRTVFYIELGVSAAASGLAAWWLVQMKRDIHKTLSGVAASLNQSEQVSLEAFPLPVVVCSESSEVIWYNEQFRTQVLISGEAYGEELTTVTGGVKLEEFQKKKSADVSCGGRRFTVYSSTVSVRDANLYIFYYVENTRYKQIAEEYALSRPAVVLFYIDNMDELLQNARDSERAQISGKVETLLEDWVSSTTGLLRKYTSDRFLLVVEQRHLQQMIINKFNILDHVRSIQSGEHMNVTLSIGVGQGKNLRESEALARQAIEMALGRGGDQAAVKTKNGFDFYGGISKGVEKRTKVRTRVVASALLELITGSDTILIMGHKYSDLDCLGSAAAFASAIRNLGKPAYVVLRRAQTLAEEMIVRYETAGRGDLFLEPEDARTLMTRKSLLIVTDTHNPKMLESAELYQSALTVAVIDHHRKMVDYIDNAVIFYHEPYASSASEMVTELIQYMGSITLSRLDAEALLAGIMLDTRSFVIKTGVRTFEAAAYLRRLGADTVEVKRLFMSSMQLYKEKSEIVSGARLYKQTAIAVDTLGSGNQIRVAAAQAANELLYIIGVEASFVLYADGQDVNISARSLGDFNVQLVMEAMGGGGHLTMAGAQIRGITIDRAKEKLTKEIDRYLEERERSKAEQSSLAN